MAHVKHGPWGCTHKNSNGFCWSSEDLTTLEALWGTVPDVVVAKRLGRTVASVRWRASKMGFRKVDQIITTAHAEAILGTSPNNLLRLVRNGFIVRKRSGSDRGRNHVWNIDEAEIGRFLRETPWMINRATMPYSKFKVEMAEWMDTGEAAERLGVDRRAVWGCSRTAVSPKRVCATPRS